MLEAYAVGVKLEMTSNVGGVLDKLIADFEKFNTLVKETSSALARLGRNLRADGSSLAGLDRMASALKSAETAGAGLTRALRSNAEYASETARAMQASARAIEQANRASSTGGSRGSSRFSEHNVMMAGMGAGIVGGALLGAARYTMTPAIDMAKSRDVLAADMRLTPEQVDAAAARARDTTKLAPGTTTGQNMSSILDLKNVFGSLDEAMKMLPEFARMSALFQVMDRKGGGSGDQAFAAAKAMEVMGEMTRERVGADGRTVRELDPELGMAHLKMMERVAVATNMRVAPSDYLGFAKQARVAGMNLTDEFTFEKLPALMQVLGGSRTGTAMMSMAQVFQGGKLTPKSLAALRKIGLADGNGISDSGVLSHDPLEWMKLAQTRMDKSGIHGSEAQINALMKASQRATIAGIFADILKDLPAILKEQQNIVNTRPDMAEHMAAADPAAKVQQFEAAMTNLATELGSAGMGDAMKVLTSLTAGLNALGDWAHANPGLARVAFDVGAGLGAVATGLGALSTAILIFGPALRLMGIGGSGAGAAGAAGSAAAGGGILSRLGPIGAVIGGWLGITSQLNPLTNSQAEKNAPQLADPHDGFDASGRPVRRGAAYMSLPGQPVRIENVIHLEGREIYRGVMDQMDRDAIRPPTSTSRPDGRMSLRYVT